MTEPPITSGEIHKKNKVLLYSLGNGLLFHKYEFLRNCILSECKNATLTLV